MNISCTFKFKMYFFVNSAVLSGLAAIPEVINLNPWRLKSQVRNSNSNKVMRLILTSNTSDTRRTTNWNYGSLRLQNSSNPNNLISEKYSNKIICNPETFSKDIETDHHTRKNLTIWQTCHRVMIIYRPIYYHTII